MKQKREWLVSLRTQLKLSQKEVAKRAKIPRSTYANYELNLRNPSVRKAQRIAGVIGFDWTIFFTP